MNPKKPKRQARALRKTRNGMPRVARTVVLEVSAGGIIYTKRRGRHKVVLVGRFKPSVTWRLPKGHPEKGESLLVAAKREVAEETGVHGSGGPKLGVANFFFTHPVSKKFIHKFVHYYLLKKTNGSVEQHDKEYDTARWFTFERAIRAASFKDDKVMLQRAKRLITRRQALAKRTARTTFR
ncbi:MAG: NUDIX domain-containing protein [Candidatus Andersenbacteria bacterium]